MATRSAILARTALVPVAAAFLLALFSAFAARPARGQEAISPLPPPVTRSLYRSHWFDFLSAHLEDDAKAAAAALAELKRSARAVGVRRLSDFSRTAVHEARKAEAIGKTDRALRAYNAAIELDDANFDAVVSRMGFLMRSRRVGEASQQVPDAISALFAARESRLSAASSLAVWISSAVLATLFGLILVLAAKNSSRIAHDLKERTRRLGFSAAVPLAILIAALPLALGLGPGWILLYWGVLVFPYASSRERSVLIAGLLAAGLLAPVLGAISRENIIERSPLWVAAVDLDERREDGSAEDGLRQASTVFAEDPDVWFLLGMYADRSGDSDRAIASYERATIADPADYRPFLNRGNVHFRDGDFKEAIRDYEAAAQRAQNAQIHYNLAVARGEAYDFDGQTAAMARARSLSARDVSVWTDHPTLSRVISAGYPLSRARRKIEDWNRQPKSRRLPGHARPFSFFSFFATPFFFGPWVAIGGAFALTASRAKRPLATECERCGIAICDSCRRFSDQPHYCTTCVRLHVRKESGGIEAHVQQTREIQRRVQSRDAMCRVLSLVFPGTHRIFSGRTIAGVSRMFLFLFLLSVAAIGGRFFDPRELPPSGSGRLPLIALAVSAALLWFFSLVRSWRESHGA
ncbi:MAG TPA: tetratricopeptide repeat protein [Thermoanaerobaculia bacterium]|nr:tetratricopeptide repeat protein [Thermoanaerobaculia bacterium]